MNSNTGKLFFDREFALVDSSGTALRLCQYPKMTSIKPYIDIERMTLEVSAPGQPKLFVDLGLASASPMKDIKVCGDRCEGKLWGSPAVSDWFTTYLNVQCWLARSDEGNVSLPREIDEEQTHGRHTKRTGFENEAPLLLLSKTSIDILNEVLEKQGSQLVNSRYFRPNLVVAAEKNCDYSNPEDQWTSVKFPESDIELSVTGQCARCSMVDIDPESGMKGKTLRALAEYRRNRGQITFGIFLRTTSATRRRGDREVWVETGELLNVI